MTLDDSHHDRRIWPQRRAIIADTSGTGSQLANNNVEHNPGCRGILHHDVVRAHGIVENRGLPEIEDHTLSMDNAFRVSGSSAVNR